MEQLGLMCGQSRYGAQSMINERSMKLKRSQQKLPVISPSFMMNSSISTELQRRDGEFPSDQQLPLPSGWSTGSNQRRVPETWNDVKRWTHSWGSWWRDGRSEQTQLLAVATGGAAGFPMVPHMFRGWHKSCYPKIISLQGIHLEGPSHHPWILPVYLLQQGACPCLHLAIYI